jgi:hypothetical protein
MKKEHIAIVILFLVVFGIRLYFAFQTPYFSDDGAYYNIRQVVNIKQTLSPIVKDTLSYGGKILYVPPLFFYMLAGLSFMFKTEFVGKFFPNLFASTIIIIAYLISIELTKNKSARFFTALIAGFVPIFFSETINSISIYSFVLPVMFFNIYCIIKIINREKDFIIYFIPSLLILRITTPTVIFLIFALLVYLMFIFLEKIKRSKIETEIILFATFLITWTLFVSFKQGFLNHGLAVLWLNIPQSILKNYFVNLNLLKAIYFVGIVPFIFGLYTIYKYAFREKDKKTYLLISFALVVGLLIWMRLIELTLALIFIGFTMTFLFVKSYDFFYNIIKNKKMKLLFTIFIFFLIVVSSVIPSLVLASNKIKQTYSKQEIDALLWLRQNTDKEDVILSTLKEGHLIATLARRKNLIDSNFMFVDNIDQRLEDAYKIYTTTSQIQAIELLNRYNIDYIYFSKRAKKDYGLDSLHYLDNACFKEVFKNDDVQIFQTVCVIEET